MAAIVLNLYEWSDCRCTNIFVVKSNAMNHFDGVLFFAHNLEHLVENCNFFFYLKLSDKMWFSSSVFGDMELIV